MRRHHSASAARSCCGASSAFQHSISAASTRPASPTIATSTATFLLMEEGSMSAWIFLESGAKAFSRPVTRSSKRAPMFSITSHPCMTRLAS